MALTTDSTDRVLGKRYRLLSPLGTGGSAHVFLARDLLLDRLVAVKVLLPALATDESFLRRFRAEARAAGSLNHPHIMRVFDWGEDADGPYLVLEYLGGGNLRQLLDRGDRLTPAQAVRVGHEAAQGLAFAHARGIVHRDVKPANLLFDEEGRVRVADFGVARALAESSWTEPVGAVIGTARYVSPEQAQGRSVDGRADVYALALVLYEAVTGVLPFVADTAVGTLMARIGRPLPAHPALGPLEEILTVAADPAEAGRPEAAGLASSLGDLATQLPPPTPLDLRPTPQVRPAGEGDDLTLHRGGGPLAAPGGGAVAAGAAVPAAALWHPGLPVPEAPMDPKQVGAGHGDVAIPGDPATAVGVTAVVPGASGPVVPATTAHQPLVGTEAVALEPAQPPPVPPAPPPSPAPRRRRRALPWILAAVGLAMLLAAGAIYAVRVKLFTPSHPVPQLVGLSLADARSAVQRDHFPVQVTARRYSTSVAVGHVIHQDPAATTTSKEGTPVNVVVSKGLPPEAVPSLLQLDCAGAQRVLSLENLNGTCPPSLARYSTSVPAGQVIDWSYQGEDRPTTAPWHSTITIVTSKGPPPVKIPRVSGTYSNAAEQLRQAGLTATETQKSSLTVPSGQVIGTNPSAGQQIPEGSSVTVIVSSGLPSIQVPSGLLGLSLGEVQRVLQAVGFKVGSVSGPHNGVVSATQPAGGQSATEGSQVAITLAKGSTNQTTTTTQATSPSSATKGNANSSSAKSNNGNGQ